MSKIIHTFALFFLSLQLFAQAGWQYLPNAPVSSRIDDIYFLNPDTGVAVLSNGKIFKTTDGGDTWSLKYNAGDYMRSLEFLNDSVGFAGSLYGTLVKTVNGGDNWTDISNLITGSFGGICGLSAVDDSVIYGVGAWYNPAYYIKSTDKGISWDLVSMNSYASGLVDCHFFSADTGFVTGIGLNDEAVILYTDDGGATWQNKFSSNVSTSYAWKIQFLSRHWGMASIASENPNSACEIVMTADSGMTWTVKTVTPQYHELEGAGFINEAHGWAAGSFSGMYETTDSGATWNFIPFGNNVDRYFKVNDTLLFCSGQSVYKFTDTASIITSIHPPPVFILSHSLQAVYPDPASDQIHIEYTLGNRTIVDLSLYDFTGKRMNRIVHGHQEKGTYQLQHDISLLPAGQYFIVLDSNEGAIISDFIRIER